MLVPNTFAIHVTYTCPLSCAHCCFSSHPENKDKLPIAHIIETIRTLDQSTIQMVAFTGGEPLLLGDKLVDAVREASSRGFVTRVVTSAYWGKNLSVARKRLEELKEAGLQEISISWDYFHEEFVTLIVFLTFFGLQ
jgi:MoaA/NifB/PqqE/SkfB family radical SAM enzyme